MFSIQLVLLIQLKRITPHQETLKLLIDSEKGAPYFSSVFFRHAAYLAWICFNLMNFEKKSTCANASSDALAAPYHHQHRGVRAHHREKCLLAAVS